MENLTKQQLILLALLVSFMTSIATGIVTVSLMQQEPQGVTQTINRVVERTIEKVVQAPSQGASVVTKETVVIKADDAVISAIGKNSLSLVRIYKSIPADGETPAREVFNGLGLIATKDGLVVTDKSVTLDDAGFYGILNDGKKVNLSLAPAAASSPVAFFKVVKNEKENIVFSSVVLGDSNAIQLGQTVIALGGDSKNSVATGIISSLETDRDVSVSATTTETGKPAVVTSIETNLSPQTISLGSLLLNLSGEVIGLNTSAETSAGAVFLPSSEIRALIQAFLIVPVKTVR